MDYEQAFISTEEASQEVRDIGDNDDLARRLVIECSEEMETILDRQIVTRGNITEFHTFWKADAELDLRWFPILSIVSVHEDADRLYANAALTEGVDYLVDAKRGRLTRISGTSLTSWATGLEAVRVIWTAGYADQAAVPGDLKRLARELFAEKYREIVGQTQSLSSVSDGLGTRARYGPAELTSHMMRRLMRHRNFNSGSETLSRFEP